MHLLLAYPTECWAPGRLIIAVSYAVISVSTLSFNTLTPNLLLVWPLPYDAVARMVYAVHLIMGAAVLVVRSRSDKDLVRADRLGAVRVGRDRTATEHNARCHR